MVDRDSAREFKRSETLMDLMVRQGISTPVDRRSLCVDLLDADETPESFLNLIEEGRRRNGFIAGTCG
jgi:hypothetical protein